MHASPAHMGLPDVHAHYPAVNVFLITINSRFLFKHGGDGQRLVDKDTGAEGRYGAGPG